MLWMLFLMRYAEVLFFFETLAQYINNNDVEERRQPIRLYAIRNLLLRDVRIVRMQC